MLELPEKAKGIIDFLAEVALEDPFLPLRLQRTVKLKVLHFFHLCSGHVREGDLEYWVCKIAADFGFFCDA